MSRPYPPVPLFVPCDLSMRMIPAPDVWKWLQAELFAETGSIHNPYHAHLLDADIRIM